MAETSPLIFFADIMRFVLVVLATLLIAVTARVIQQYYRASRAAMKEGDFRGILPTHVWLIGVSYVLLVAGSVVHHIVSLRTDPDVYLAINTAAYTSGAIALWLILRFENRRVNIHDAHLKEHRHHSDTGTLPAMNRRQSDAPPSED